jgi:two-component system LytT family response regulator
MRALLVDDEAPARLKLKALLAAERDVEVVGEARDGAEAVEQIRAGAPDLIFLDVQMPVLDGFGVVEQVGPDRMPAVVFVTAFDEHAVRAFDVHALDYLLKPVSPERFRAAVARVRSHLANRAATEIGTMAAQLRDLLAGAGRSTGYLRRLLVHDDRRALLVPVDRLIRVEAERNYLRLYATGGVYQLRATLTELERRLDPGQFLRINRSELVRLDAVDELQPWSHGDYRVVLRDGSVRTWSRRYRRRTEDAFGLGPAS